MYQLLHNELITLTLLFGEDLVRIGEGDVVDGDEWPDGPPEAVGEEEAIFLKEFGQERCADTHS